MRIGLVIPGGLDATGAERSIPALEWLVARLARRHVVEVVSLRQEAAPRSFDVHGAHVHDLGLAGRRGPGAVASAMARAAAWLSRREAVDVWHGLWLGTPAAIAVAAAAWQRRPMVASIMGTEFADAPGQPARSSPGRALARWTARRAARVTAGSTFQAAQAQRHGIRCTVVPLGVPREWFGDAPRRARGGQRLLHVGDLNRWKDQVTLLDAFAIVRAHHPGAHLDIAGIDTLDGAIQRAATARGLDEAVTFHGKARRDAVRALCVDATLLVMSSRHESQCVAVVEAAAVGLATVGTRVGLIADGNAAWTQAVPVGDAPALAAAVCTLLDDDARRLHLGTTAHAWAAAHDADWTASQFEAIYADAIARHRPGT
jgi:glycosyltransferase involved in cell wall biosynthesis